MILGPTDLAKVLRVSRNMVAKYRREGKITPNPEGKYDLDAVRVELAAKLRPRRLPLSERFPNAGAAAEALVRTEEQDSKTGRSAISEERARQLAAGAMPSTLSEAQLQHEMEKIRKLRTANHQEQGDLISAQEAREAWAGMLSAIRSTLLLLPSKLAPRVAAVDDVLEAQTILDQEIKRILTRLSEYEPGKMPHAA